MPREPAAWQRSPAVIQLLNSLSHGKRYSRPGSVTETLQVLVPDMTAESPEQSAESINRIREREHFAAPSGNGGESTFGDPGCILYTTTLVYNVQNGQDGLRKYDLISFRLDREIYTMAPYNRVHNATARVKQAGFSDVSGDTGLLEEQCKDLGEIEFGKTYSEGHDWPENWFAPGTALRLCRKSASPMRSFWTTPTEPPGHPVFHPHRHLTG